MLHVPPSESPSAWRWIQVALLSVNLGWTTLCLGGIRAQTMVVTSVLTAALIFVHGAWWLFARESAAGEARQRKVHPAALLLVPFLLYALANVLWVTPVCWLGWMDWFGWLQAFAVFWVAVHLPWSRGERWFLWGLLFTLGVTLVVLGAYQLFMAPGWLMLERVQVQQYTGRASGSFGIPNSMAAFLLLILPSALALAVRRRASASERVFFGWLAVLLLFGLGLTISRGAWIGFALALTAWPVFGSRRSWWRRLAFSAAVGIAVLTAGMLAYATSARVRERVVQFVSEAGELSRPILWRAGWKMAREQPWVGTGAGSFNAEFERHRPEGFLHEPVWAHNDYLNTLSDYGWTGFVLLFGALGTIAVVCWRRAPLSAAADERSRLPGMGSEFRPVHRGSALDTSLLRQAQAIGLLAFALQLFVDFHFKIPALAMACALVGGLLVATAWMPAVANPSAGAGERQPRHRGRARKSATWWVGFGCVACVIVIVTRLVPLYRGEALREQARETIDLLASESVESERFRTRLLQARADLARAVSLAPANARAWADKSLATAQWSRRENSAVAELGREAESDANRALSLAPVLAEGWIRRGVALDMQGRWTDAGGDFTRAISLAPKLPQGWFHYAYHLSLRPTGMDMARAMTETCLRLDPQNRDGLRLRHQLATGPSRP